MKKQTRDFKGIWIPKEIWLSEGLTLQEKVFLVEIDSLDNKDGCYANNQYFAEFFGISKTRVSLVISSLVDKGFINSEIDQSKGNKRTLKTLFNKTIRPSQTKVNDPRKQKLMDNNTVINPINNTTKKEKTLPPYFAMQISEIILKKAKPTHTKTQIIQGAGAIEKINRLDGHPIGEIIATIEWALKDAFWKDKVLSPVRLREKRRIRQGNEWILDSNTKFDNIHRQWKSKPETTEDRIKRLNEER